MGAGGEAQVPKEFKVKSLLRQDFLSWVHPVQRQGGERSEALRLSWDSRSPGNKRRQGAAESPGTAYLPTAGSSSSVKPAR